LELKSTELLAIDMAQHTCLDLDIFPSLFNCLLAGAQLAAWLARVPATLAALAVTPAWPQSLTSMRVAWFLLQQGLPHFWSSFALGITEVEEKLGRYWQGDVLLTIVNGLNYVGQTRGHRAPSLLLMR